MYRTTKECFIFLVGPRILLGAHGLALINKGTGALGEMDSHTVILLKS